MIPQTFSIIYDFQPRRRRRWRIALPPFAIRLSSEAEEYCAVSGRRSQHRTRLSAQSAEDHANKIAQLRRAVESGTYCVSAEQIAVKIAQQILVDLFT